MVIKRVKFHCKRPRLSTERAGLSFSVHQIARSLKNHTLFDKMGFAAPIYLAAVLEYISLEVLELACDKARNENMTRILPRHVQFTIWNDVELLDLLGKVTLCKSTAPIICTSLDAQLPSSSRAYDG